MSSSKIPLNYVPLSLSPRDKRKQREMIVESRQGYKKKIYVTREKVPSFKSKPSKHILNARRIYKISTVKPSKELSEKTGCSLSALKKIVRKGQGAYYSSGSRPNQTATSWGYARLASSLTGGKAAVVDFRILSEGCKHDKTAFKLAEKARGLKRSKLSKLSKLSNF